MFYHNARIEDVMEWSVVKPTIVLVYDRLSTPNMIQLNIIRKIAREWERFDVATINISENTRLGIQYKIVSTPTTIIFKNKEIHERFGGFATEDDIIAKAK